MFQRILAGWAVACLPLLASAQAEGSAKAVHKVGDVAVYSVELRADNRTTEETVTVTAIDGDLIRTRHARPDRPEQEGVLTEQFGLAVSGASGSRFDPPIPLVKWPLTAGANWKTRYDMVMANQARSKVDLDVKIVSSEKLRTPAGEFDTVKVESGGWVTGVSWSGSVRIAQVQWFAPSIGRLVRSEYRSFRGGQPWEHTVYELKSFKPGP
ncbi:MAG: hypothetical protein IBJ14_12245 [Hydrogenophaga sp.]|nr:hypothetical protein [Hydrogenophaga sp.]